MYWITGLLGLILAAAPWLFQYSDNTTAMWTSLALGAVIVLASAVKGFLHDAAKWEYWVAGLAGIVAIAAPFVLDFTALTAALWASIIIGAIVVIVAGYESFVSEPGTV